MGGDGAFHEVVNALHRHAPGAVTGLRLAHLPTGSTDAVACSLTGTRSVFGAAARMALGAAGRLDVLAVTPDAGPTGRACCIAAAGFMGDVCAAAEAWRGMGPLRYDLLGARALLMGRGVPATIRFRDAALRDRARDVLGPGADDAVCLAGCRVCALAQAPGGWPVEGGRGPGGNDDSSHDPAGVENPASPWRTLSGRWRSIMLIVTPCRSDKTPAGMARTGHLADGRLKLVLVPDVGPLGLLRVLESMARRGLAAGDPGPVIVHDAEEVEVQAGQDAEACGLDWNVDGEHVRARSLHARMERAALRVFSCGVEGSA